MRSFLFFLVLNFSFLISQAQLSNHLVDDVAWFEEVPVSKKASAKKNVFTLYSKKAKPVVIITSHRPQDVTIMVYNKEGEMVYEGILKHHEKATVEVEVKGIYSYSIHNDEKVVEEGKLIIK